MTADGVITQSRVQIMLHTKNPVEVHHFIRSMITKRKRRGWAPYTLVAQYVSLDGTRPTVLTFDRPEKPA